MTHKARALKAMSTPNQPGRDAQLTPDQYLKRIARGKPAYGPGGEPLNRAARRALKR